MSAPEVPLDDLRDLLTRALMAREMEEHPEIMLIGDTWENGLTRAQLEADKLLAHMRVARDRQRRRPAAS